MNFIQNETLIRVLPFFSGLVIFFIIGLLVPLRKDKRSLSSFFSNIFLTFFNSFVVGVILPLSLGTWAIKVTENGWGLFNILKSANVFNIITTIIIMDMVVYWQHRFFHTVPILWKLHRVHHTDITFDTSTALRFHTFEILISTISQAFFIFLLGSNYMAVILFSSILNFSAMFNHSNFSLPTKIENFCVKLIVTPDMHRIHHSVLKNETNSNYGFFLAFWDKMFGTYINKPQDDPIKMDIGIEEFRDEKEHRIDRLLTQPFRSIK